MTRGQEASHLTGQMFTVYRNNYLEECYFSFSYSPIPDDNGGVGGVFTTVLDMTDRVIEDRRRRLLRDLTSRTAEARDEEEVWRVSAKPDDDLHAAVIDSLVNFFVTISLRRSGKCARKGACS
jgi:hypothetical protein